MLTGVFLGFLFIVASVFGWPFNWPLCHFIPPSVRSLGHLGEISKLEHLLQRLSFSHALVLIMRRDYSRENPSQTEYCFQVGSIDISRGPLCGTLCSVGNICLWGFRHREAVSSRARPACLHTDNSPTGPGLCRCLQWRPQPCPPPVLSDPEVWSKQKCPQRGPGQCPLVTGAQPVTRTESSVTQRCYL